MTLQDCYEALGGDYEDVISRLRSENLVLKFLFRFLEDSSYQLLCQSMKDNQDDEAFRAAHTIKGVCQNLSFTRLLKTSSEMSDAFRHGRTPEADEIFVRLTEDYHITIAAIQKLKDTLEG